MEIKTVIYNEKTTQGWSESLPLLDSEKTLILVFASPEFSNNQKPIHELREHYPKSKIIGCSSAGEISGKHILDNSMSVAIIKFNETPLEIVKKELTRPEDSEKVGESIAKALDKEDLHGIFVLSEGLNVNGSALVNGLNQGVNKKIVITGGLAGDGNAFKKTWVLYNGEILLNSVVAIGLYGNKIQIGHASRGGWHVFGPERLVTRSQNNVLYELDDRPALALYKEYLGKKASELPSSGLLYPLAIRKNDKDDDQLVRTILSVDENAQSLTFAGDIPEGWLAQLMRSNFDRLITSASEAGKVAFDIAFKKHHNNIGPILSIAISCVGRRLLLGERTQEETESLLENFPPETKQVGFYSYGELSPYATGDCRLHNQTMTVTTFYEQ